MGPSALGGAQPCSGILPPMITLLTDEVAACVGTEVTYVAPEPLGAASIRYFALAIGSESGRVPTLICETTQLTGRMQADADGYLGHSWDLPLPVPCTMIRGGNDYRFGRDARADDVITSTWRLDDMAERIDADGRPLLIVTAEATYRSGDDWLATNTETLIYRPTNAS